MKPHENFLQFNGVEILTVHADGIDWIALKPILDALNIAANSSIKRTKRDAFLGAYTSTMTLQVYRNGVLQGRKMTCLPEKYIYGWLGQLNGDSEELLYYKETCYNLLYDHFKGMLGRRKQILTERQIVQSRIKEIKDSLNNNNPLQTELHDLEKKNKSLNSALVHNDKNILQQHQLFPI